MSAFDDPNYFTNTMFSYPSYDPNHLAPGPSSDYLSQQRHSISSTSDIFPLLSPSASSNGSAFQAPPSLQHTSGSNSQSPRSSASPRSNGFYDTSVSDVDLDELLNLSAGDANGMNVFGGDYDQKPQMMNNNGDMQMQMQPQNLFLPNSGFGTMGGNGGGFDFGKLQADQLASMLFQQQQHQQQQQLQTMAPSWMQSQQEVLKHQFQFSQAPHNLFDFQNAKPLPTSEFTPPVTKAKAAPKAAARRGPKPKENDENTAPLGPSGGKHNKTERRYRQKVQAAQTELRDSVPALRVLYGTSTEEQKQTTDIKLADGSVDGLGEITRPNASAKTTIFVGAKLYIELLQDRVAGLQRRVDELENYRSAVGGQADLDSWKSDFEQREKQRRELKELADQIKRSEESEEDMEEEEEEEEEPVVKRKKARKTVVKKEEGSSTVVRTFAAFAMTFSFLPSADKTFTTIPVHALPLSNPTTGQVITRLPIITAEHTARLLSRGLPSGSVPHPTALVEWGWRILVAVVVAAVLGPIFRRISKMTRPGLVTTVKETAKYVARVEGKPNPTTVAYAAGIGGGVVRPSRMSYWYTIMHLNRTSSDAYQLALLALLQPRNRFLPSSESLWKLARASIDETTPASLVAVLDTPLVEAAHYLSNTTTSDPIASISNQLTLVQLNDLYIRMFTKLVMASTNPDGPLPTSTRALLQNLDRSTVGKDLRSSSFDREIRDVIQITSKGTASHALGLVLIGLWGIFTGPAPSSQAALVSALAAEEMLGQANISSVSAMLNLLYPGSSQPQPQSSSMNVNGNGNAQAIDRLALVCIEYLKLLLSSSSAKTRTERLEASKQIQRVSTNLRLALTLTEFVGLRGVEKDEDGFVLAKERLVGVLSNLGRRARGRVVSGDIDSGLEPEIDEL